MKPITVAEIITATGGKLVASSPGDHDVLVSSVSTDTRTLSEGSLFIALRGDHFNGHAFLADAIKAGAACLVVDELPKADGNPEAPMVLVKDTLLALQRLAKWYRQQLDIKVIGITGSNGKTSTKDFTAAVLGGKFKVNATKGNLNNHIGLPLSVLSAEETDQVCVWEMGMSHAGEIAPLCEIAAPDIGIITNIGTAHIEFLKTREGIAEEKSALARALPQQGTLVVPASCDFVDYLIERTQAKVIVAGNCRGKVRAEDLHITDSGSAFTLCIDHEEEVPVELHVSGKHMVNNALLAAAAGHALGMRSAEIAQGLSKAQLTGGRLQKFVSEGVTVFDDTYNANPDSVIAAIDTLAELPVHNGARRLVILGKMAELGPHSDEEHRRVGKAAAEKNLTVVSVGVDAEKIYDGASEVSDTAHKFDDVDSAAAWIRDFCKEGDSVLFKGSRTAGMENVMHKAFPGN
ncbi:MAG: UDP-N-acetylmuramoyl-tripeptide--D-alanyl-D-alanine ligase [Akkermansiaceae bacterium]